MQEDWELTEASGLRLKIGMSCPGTITTTWHVEPSHTRCVYDCAIQPSVADLALRWRSFLCIHTAYPWTWMKNIKIVKYFICNKKKGMAKWIRLLTILIYLTFAKGHIKWPAHFACQRKWNILHIIKYLLLMLADKSEKYQPETPNLISILQVYHRFWQRNDTNASKDMLCV